MTNSRRRTLTLAVIGALAYGAISLAARAEAITGQPLVAQADPVDTAPVALDPATVPDPPVSWAPEEGAAAEVPDPSEQPELGSNEDLLAKYEALKEAWENRDEAGGGVLAWAAIGAALAWLLIAGLKRVGTWTDRGKRMLPLVALALGVVAGFLAEVVGGMPWWQALVAGAGPPLSVFLHELIKNARGDGTTGESLL